MENSILIQNVTPEEFSELLRPIIREELSRIQQNATTKYLTRQEVTKLLKITLPTLHEYTRAGIIKGSRIGSRILYLEENVLNSVKEIPLQKYKRR